jgi:hypothetical protein
MESLRLALSQAAEVNDIDMQAALSRDVRACAVDVPAEAAE